MSDTPYADRVIYKQCGVCMKEKPTAALQRQWGGVGAWWACWDCIRAEDERRKAAPGPDAVLSQGKAKAPERGLFEETE